MYLAHYTYSHPDPKADAGKIGKTVFRIIEAGSRVYAEKLIQEIHANRGEKVEGNIELIESFRP